MLEYILYKLNTTVNTTINYIVTLFSENTPKDNGYTIISKTGTKYITYEELRGDSVSN
jgi:hypothetical protein